LGGQAAEHRAIGVNDMPFALIQIDYGQIRFHLKNHQRSRQTTKLRREVNSHFQKNCNASEAVKKLKVVVSALRADFEPQARRYTQSAFLRPKSIFSQLLTLWWQGAHSVRAAAGRGLPALPIPPCPKADPETTALQSYK
jgi:hypothetical protein